MPAADVLVADDNSPDGTGELADELAAGRRRRSTSSTARARRASAPPTSPASPGAWSTGYDVLVEMDADGSHPPEQLPDLLERIDAGADLVLGSR